MSVPNGTSTSDVSRRVSLRRLPRAGLVAVGLAALALASCSSSSGGSGPQNSGSPGGVQGGILRVGSTDEITTFNPFSADTDITGTALSAVYPGLLDIAYDEKDGIVAVPGLATSWVLSDDGLTYTYTLKSGVTWSDGEPLTSEDVAWTLNTVLKYGDGPTGSVSYLLDGIKTVEAPDPTTVIITYDHPNALAQTGIAQVSILPPQVWEPLATGNGAGLQTFLPYKEGKLVTAGPYTVKQYEKQGTTIFVRDPNYSGKPSNADAVAVTYYTNSAAMANDIKTGKLDWVANVPYSAAPALDGYDNVAVKSEPSPDVPTLWFNSNPRNDTDRELLNPDLRKALGMCMNRQEIIDTVFGGHAQPIATILTTLAADWRSPDVQPLPQDCDQANAMLDAMGYQRGSDGIRVVPAAEGQPAHPMDYTLTRGNANSENFDLNRVYQILSQAWGQLGVKLDQKDIGDFAAQRTFLYGADCDWTKHQGYTGWALNITTSIAEYVPLDTLSGNLIDAWCSWNFSGYVSEEYDKLWAKAIATIDPAKRKPMVWELDKMFVDSYAGIPLAQADRVSATSTKWTGFVQPILSQTAEAFTEPHMVQ